LSGASIRIETGPRGEVLHVLPFPPSDLPAVARFHLEQGWDAAREAALNPRAPSRTRGFRFAPPSTMPVDLLLADRDAQGWTAGIERVADFSTAYGISLCLRLLALVALMGSAGWLRPWFGLSRAGVEIHPALLQAAALAPLTPAGGFAETSLRALLPAALQDAAGQRRMNGVM
jgi:hypothetical protein